MTGPGKQASILLALLGLLLAGGVASASASTMPRPQLSTVPALAPVFGWNRTDYAVRCPDRKVELSVNATSDWDVKVGDGGPRPAPLALTRSLAPGRAFALSFLKGGKVLRVFHIRCLPTDFPVFRLHMPPQGAPRLTLVQLGNRYAVAFDRHGAPVWWQKTPDGSGNDAKLLPDGTFAYAPVDGVTFRQYVIRTLTGRKIRNVTAAGGLGTDVHDLQLLANGNYLIGAHRRVPGIDTSRFGGRPDSTIDTAVVQELTKSGRLVWSWNAWPRIRLAETGRWWETIGGWGEPFDVNHWNSIDRDGRRILLSFRHQDAVYCVDRRTGRILWKLGGTRTAKSLRIKGDPNGKNPFGGQHDARFVKGGITVFDNATGLERQSPRAVRYRIDPRRKLAVMVDQVKDPTVPYSLGQGGARIDGRGNWVVSWGASNAPRGVGFYPRSGGSFGIETPTTFSYRANPVTSKQPTIQRLRNAMNRVATNAG